MPGAVESRADRVERRCESEEGCSQMVELLSPLGPSFMSFMSFLHSVQFSSVAQLCPTLCNPMDCSTPALPVHHHLTEFTQTHVH